MPRSGCSTASWTMGLFCQVEAGRARVYRLNRDHVAAEPISQLAELRPRLFRRSAARTVRGLAIPPHFTSSVFGSAARGDGDMNSDVDIFLVRPGDVPEDDEEWRRQVVSAG